jgi:hypothetical protein
MDLFFATTVLESQLFETRYSFPARLLNRIDVRTSHFYELIAGSYLFRNAACTAANLATGTRGGEQLT